MNFNDIFKKSFLSQIETTQTVDVVLAVLISIVIGAYIYWFYKKTYKGVMFSKMFATALAGMTVITTFIILAVTSNVVLSLGMVGALSIVRFRSSIKEPVDIVYIFWAISEGIVIGSGQYLLALIGTIGISLAIATFSTHKDSLGRYILVVRYVGDENKIIEVVKKIAKKYDIKSNTLYSDSEQEIIAEVIMEKDKNNLVEKLKENKSVKMVSLVKYNGEYIIEQ